VVKNLKIQSQFLRFILACAGDNLNGEIVNYQSWCWKLPQKYLKVFPCASDNWLIYRLKI
jgi:hypothetical protein